MRGCGKEWFIKLFSAFFKTRLSIDIIYYLPLGKTISKSTLIRIVLRLHPLSKHQSKLVGFWLDVVCDVCASAAVSCQPFVTEQLMSEQFTVINESPLYICCHRFRQSHHIDWRRAHRQSQLKKSGYFSGHRQSIAQFLQSKKER